jgi:hypothetical protein
VPTNAPYSGTLHPMSRLAFQKSVRMFHKFSDETLRRRGGDQAGREGVVALAAIEAVLKAERLFDGALLEPLAAFTNLLQSSQLPPEFGDYSLGDALLAIEDAHAELRQNAEQRWEFEPELSDEAAATLALPTANATPGASGGEHGTQLRRFVLEAAQAAEPGAALVVGALASPELPLAELAARFERLTLSDLDLVGLEALVRRVVPEQHRNRIQLERYDLTGCYAAFVRGVKEAVAGAGSLSDAESAVAGLLESYDVGAGSAGLARSDEKPALAISAMVLSKLGHRFSTHISAELAARSWDPQAVSRAPIAPALAFLRCLLAQHHIHALLRRAKSAVLVSAVSEVVLPSGPGAQDRGASEPTDLLLVERLVERLPQIADVKAEQSWEWRQDRPAGDEKRSLLTLVEAVLV